MLLSLQGMKLADYRKDTQVLIYSVHSLMRKISFSILSAQLRRVTPVWPVISNASSWGSCS